MTPRKRGHNGQLMGPIPLHMPPADSAYEREEGSGPEGTAGLGFRV